AADLATLRDAGAGAVATDPICRQATERDRAPGRPACWSTRRRGAINRLRVGLLARHYCWIRRTGMRRARGGNGAGAAHHGWSRLTDRALRNTLRNTVAQCRRLLESAIGQV